MSGTVLRCICAWLAVAGLLFAAAPLRAATEDAAKDPIASQAEAALWWGDIDALERLYAEARTNSEVNSWNGRSAVQSVRSGLAEVFKYSALNDAYFRELELLTARWAEERPKALLPQLIYARALYARAWHVRGGGFWQTVPASAKVEFTRLIAKAEKHIADRAPLLMKDTTTHIYLLLIGRSAGWSFVQMQAVAEDALGRSNADELVFYEDLTTALMPKWGGDWDKVTAFIEEVDQRTRDRRGHELYAQLWSTAANNIEGNLYKELRVDWPRMKEGFERITARLSHPYYANRMAYFACLAEDRDAARAALARIGSEPDVDVWAAGGAGGQQNYEACVRWLATQR